MQTRGPRQPAMDVQKSALCCCSVFNDGDFVAMPEASCMDHTLDVPGEPPYFLMKWTDVARTSSSHVGMMPGVAVAILKPWGLKPRRRNPVNEGRQDGKLE